MCSPRKKKRNTCEKKLFLESEVDIKSHSLYEGDWFSFSKHVTFEASVLGAAFFTAAAEICLSLAQLLSQCLHL